MKLMHIIKIITISALIAFSLCAVSGTAFFELKANLLLGPLD